MAMLLKGMVILAWAAVALVALMVTVTFSRVRKLRWRPVQSHSVARGDVPPADRQTLDQAAQTLIDLGFSYRGSGVAGKSVVTDGRTDSFFDLYQHADGHTHAMVSPSPVPERHQPCMIQLITCLNDGSNWITLNRFKHFWPMEIENWQVFDDYLPQWQDCWPRHLAHVQTAHAGICADAVEFDRRLHQSFEDLVPQMLRRGLLVAASHGNTEGESFRMAVSAALRLTGLALLGQWRAAWVMRSVPVVAATAAPSAEGGGAELQAFEEHLALRRAAPASTRSKLVTFVVTALLFLLVGGLWLSWSFVPIVLAVVALHEGGHYLAMKLTGYRNVSVFFLPGLGGLATGEKATATPLEKLFVYLAGPMPGIALVGLAYWANAHGWWAGPGWIQELLVATLVINYLNLLPIVPLDGGRVVETLVFARLPRLRFAFAALCCVLLLGAGLYFEDTVMAVIAVLVAIGLPHQRRMMQLNVALQRGPQTSLDEPEALHLIFSTLQQTRFGRWSFSDRTAAATSLLPELMGRRPSAKESAIGLLIYAVCLLGPIAVAVVAYPGLRSMASVLGPQMRMVPDDVDPEPARAPTPPPPDWNAKLAQAAQLSPDELLQAHLGAAQQASDSEDTDTARTHYRAAWAIAKDLPTRDLRRIDTLAGLADLADSDDEHRDYLNQIVNALVQPQGPERLKVAQAQEQLSYSEPAAANRVRLLREAIALRTADAQPTDPTAHSVQLQLARALDDNAEIAAAEAVLRQRVDDAMRPALNDRSRQALEQRVLRVTARNDLVWFLIAHGRAADAQQAAEQSLQELSAKTSVSWVSPQLQALEAAVWADLAPTPGPALAGHWQAYEAARTASFNNDRKQLLHEADRALVAQALNDAKLLVSARNGLQDAAAALNRRPPALCNPPTPSGRANWREPQQKRRAQVLQAQGVCSNAQ